MLAVCMPLKLLCALPLLRPVFGRKKFRQSHTLIYGGMILAYLLK
ncbi:MAG: hypothetical protein QOF24_181 [Verrucomicrobiota bacterium]